MSAQADGVLKPRFNRKLLINRNIPQSQYQYSCGVAWRELAIGNRKSRADRDMRSTLYVCSSSHNFSFFSTCENFFNHFYQLRNLFPSKGSFSYKVGAQDCQSRRPGLCRYVGNVGNFLKIGVQECLIRRPGFNLLGVICDYKKLRHGGQKA